MRTIWRRPPHGQADIVSVRLGTVLQLTVPHAWQTSSATAAMSSGLPDPASSPPCNLRDLSLGDSSFVQLASPLRPRAARLPGAGERETRPGSIGVRQPCQTRIGGPSSTPRVEPEAP
jgi:hypothetical protein